MKSSRVGASSVAPERVLVVKLSSLGDVVHATGCLRAVRRAWPNAAITVAVEARFAALLRACPYVDRLIGAETGGSTVSAWRDARRALRGDPPLDLAIDLQGGRRSAAWIYASGARSKVGRGGFRPGWRCAVRPAADRHAVAVCADVLEATTGIASDDPSPELFIDAGADRDVAAALAQRGLPSEGFVLVNPFSRWRSKEWPPDRYAAAIEALWCARRSPIAIIGGPGEDARAAQLVALVHAAPVVSLVGALTLDQALALYRRAALMLTGDSGPMHAAAALGTPVVALFGPTLPERTGPWGSGHVVLQTRRPAAPDAYRRDPDGWHIGGIELDAVVAAVARSLAGADRRAAGRPGA